MCSPGPSAPGTTRSTRRSADPWVTKATRQQPRFSGPIMAWSTRCMPDGRSLAVSGDRLDWAEPIIDDPAGREAPLRLPAGVLLFAFDLGAVPRPTLLRPRPIPLPSLVLLPVPPNACHSGSWTLIAPSHASAQSTDKGR